MQSVPLKAQEAASFGAQLTTWRKQVRLSQREAADRANISRATLQNWEAGRNTPRATELDALFTVLNVADAQREQVRWYLYGHTSREGVASQEAGDGKGHEPSPTPSLMQPNGGDLIRAMRMRAHLSQEAVADRLRVARTTVMRWERGDTLVPVDRQNDLFTLLNALPAEQNALTNPRTLRAMPLPGYRNGNDLLHDTSPDTTLPSDTLRDVFFRLRDKVRSSQGDALDDLRFISLESRLYPLVGRDPFAAELLSRVYIEHSFLMLEFHRNKEALCNAERVRALIPEIDSAGSRSSLQVWCDTNTAIQILTRPLKPNPKQAYRRFSDLLHHAPTDSFTGRSFFHSWRGKCLSDIGDMLGAVHERQMAYETAVDLHPEVYHRSRLEFARALGQAGQHNIALQYLTDEAGDLPGWRCEATLIRCQVLLMANDLEGAAGELAAVQTALSTDPHNTLHIQMNALAAQIAQMS